MFKLKRGDLLKHLAIKIGICKHVVDAHGDKNLINEDQFRVVKKCRGKFDCLVYECYLSKNGGLALTLKVIPLVLNSLFSLKHISLPFFLNELLFFLVFIEYSYRFFLLDNDVG